jgi:hypothetical protein
MKAFLSLTAILEGITGLALILVPTYIIPLLLSTPVEETGGIIAARIAGIAIASLALACWFSKNNKNNSGIVKSLLFYNFAIIAIFIYAVMIYELTSQFLGLVVVAHIGLGFWGVILLKKK